jgi:hypothetical protein
MSCDTEFGGEKSRRACGLGRPHLVGFLEYLRDAEVDDLEDIVVGKEEVVWLDVTMDNSLGMYCGG